MANRGMDGQFLRCDRRDPLVRKVLDRLDYLQVNLRILPVGGKIARVAALRG